ncbi:MAG: hypothetical protein R3F46_03685 [bacterium]
MACVRGDDDAGVNGNDLDFQFPFHAYVEWDDTLGAIPGDVEAAEIIDVNYAGIAMSDISADWTKFTAPYGGVFDPGALGLNKAAAYFLSQTDSFGSFDTASYGDSFGPNLTFSNDDDLVATEAIAHWSQGTLYGGSPAFLAWAMFPGHKSVKYNGGGTAVGYYAEGGILWEDFIEDHDIQTGRDLWGYLRSDYSFTTPGEGRTVDFDYGTVVGWNGDLNRNGVFGEAADKFPVRVRFFTDIDAYDDYFFDINGYPNFWPDGDTFIEGGCYVVDEGDPNYPVSIFDDADEEDPTDTVSGAGPYDVDLFFEIAFGVGPYDVDLDWNYNFVTFGAGGFTQPVGTYPAAGKWGETVNIDPTPAGGDGNYSFALMVTDANNDTDEFFWPDQVSLTPGGYFIDYMEAYTNTGDALAAGWTRSSNSSDSWWVGAQWDGMGYTSGGAPEFVAPGPVVIGAWGGQMWHGNGGEGISDTGANYLNNTIIGLRSPGFGLGAGDNAWLHYRLALDAENDSWEQYWHGGSTGSVAGSSPFGWNLGNFEVAHGVSGLNVNSSTQQHFNMGISTGGTTFVHFHYESDGSVNWFSGPHVDGINVTEGNFPVIGS